MVKDSFYRYYGAVIEVSRGCPFLCEFCDIRIMKDNNRPHNKNIKVIIDQLDYLSGLGIKQILIHLIQCHLNIFSHGISKKYLQYFS